MAVNIASALNITSIPTYPPEQATSPQTPTTDPTPKTSPSPHHASSPVATAEQAHCGADAPQHEETYEEVIAKVRAARRSASVAAYYASLTPEQRAARSAKLSLGHLAKGPNYIYNLPGREGLPTACKHCGKPLNVYPGYKNRSGYCRAHHILAYKDPTVPHIHTAYYRRGPKAGQPRLCRHCPNIVEPNKYFLRLCKQHYKEFRARYAAKVLKWDNEHPKCNTFNPNDPRQVSNLKGLFAGLPTAIQERAYQEYRSMLAKYPRASYRSLRCFIGIATTHAINGRVNRGPMIRGIMHYLRAKRLKRY